MDENYCSNTKKILKKKKAIWLSLHELQKNSGVIVRMCALYTFSIVVFFSSNQGWMTKKTKQNIYISLTRVLGR